jgi:hypothetical protein
LRYVWDRSRQAFVDRDGKAMEAPDRVCLPMIASDLPAYPSPLGTGMIEGRAARREELKRSGCREVDPSEFKPKFVNKSWAKRRGYTTEE